MFEVFAMFKNYTIPYELTESSMIAQTYLTAWVTRYPHARIESENVKREVKDSSGSSWVRSVMTFRVRINELVPEDLRA